MVDPGDMELDPEAYFAGQPEEWAMHDAEGYGLGDSDEDAHLHMDYDDPRQYMDSYYAPEWQVVSNPYTDPEDDFIEGYEEPEAEEGNDDLNWEDIPF